jgi:ferredoxin
MGPGARIPPESSDAAQGGPDEKEDEVALLKRQAEELAQQLQETRKQIRQPEGSRHMGAKVDADKCTGCGLCVDVCPMEAIRLEEDLAVIDEEKCNLCGQCVEECPNDAIRLV